MGSIAIQVSAVLLHRYRYRISIDQMHRVSVSNYCFFSVTLLQKHGRYFSLKALRNSFLQPAVLDMQIAKNAKGVFFFRTQKEVKFVNFIHQTFLSGNVSEGNSLIVV